MFRTPSVAFSQTLEVPHDRFPPNSRAGPRAGQLEPSARGREARLAELVVATQQSLSEGDLSENSGLEELRFESDRLRAELSKLREQLETLDGALLHRLTDTVGMRFTLRLEQGSATPRTLERVLLLSEELGVRMDAVSDASPVGQHLLRASVGTRFSVEVPRRRSTQPRTLTFTVLEIAAVVVSAEAQQDTPLAAD